MSPTAPLREMADASPNEKFRNANRLRRSLEPMGTPFLYAAFAGFPADYERACVEFERLRDHFLPPVPVLRTIDDRPRASRRRAARTTLVEAAAV